ncbi:hypothetical protein SCP_1401730 [Sparassis crispa]|uniref:Uncharacterized protein n=1 Tax=Sparassis crispa TaxID=139825 RepID=A0A401H2X2_9APHY|nr:hypothetical protein SCP_1401730 [Sparassis crispa]GBE88768.1 hypothetical protein SCP_1401730 [Sparassis crispa]
MCRFISRPHEFDPAACPLVSFARGVAKAHLDNRRQGKFFPYTEETSIDTKDAIERENLNGLIPRLHWTELQSLCTSAGEPPKI